MATLVMKFGGTSVADPDLIRRCALRLAAASAEGHRVVAVVSAMGHSTDHLIDLAEKVSPAPRRRELDALMATGEQVSCALVAMALAELGIEGVSLTGAQVGIHTDDSHGRARVLRIERHRLEHELAHGRLPIVAGFQGIRSNGDITTLGRGGSDTTAVALAAALDVSRDGGCCEIYTDVDGVYTADPRIVPQAVKLARISYEEMLELAALGAGVMHARAVIFGEKFGVPIHVRHSQKPDAGTIISEETPDMEEITVIGAALKPDLGRVTLRGLPAVVGLQGRLFEAIAKRGILVDDIVQTESQDAMTISVTVEHGDLAETKTVAGQFITELGRGDLSVEVGLAKVSAVGTGMKSHSGVASRMFRALGDAGIPIQNITTSEIKISCIVPREHGEHGLRVIHQAFELEKGDRSRAVDQPDRAAAQ
ncbi:MAG: aspartate kinase [Phycisphaeraceae bacterium]|nr:aspartate kinase [Phycisphaeraceae bacterium]